MQRNLTMLTEVVQQRFKRNILLPEVGEEGQARLLDAKVLVVGAGGLGSPVAMYLAASGIGTLGIADGDVVDISNLQRQLLHHTADIGKEKVKSAKAKLTSIRPEIHVEQYECRLDEDGLKRVVGLYDFVIDATDTITAKLQINDVCIAMQKPFSHGGIYRFCGEAMTVVPPNGACYRCAYSPGLSANPTSTAPPAGPLGPVAGIIGCIQATECIKYLLGMKDLLVNTLMVIDARGMEFRKVRIRRDPRCGACGEERRG